MGLDVGLTFGCRIKSDLLHEEHEGCPNCRKQLETSYCAICGSKSTKYKTYKFIDKEEANKLDLEECYYGDDGYRYITASRCVREAKDNPRAGDMMFFKAATDLQNKFIEDTILSVRKAFGINLKQKDFGYFITMSS